MRNQMLKQDDPAPVRITNPHGASPFLLIGDHAGNLVPGVLGSLGLSDAELAQHIGWDIGIAGLGEVLAARMDAAFVHQVYSRLVIDCNRAPDAIDAMPEVSDGTRIPGNQALDDAAKAKRVAAIHEPYHRAIGDGLAARDAAGRETVLVALHSFTPAMRGEARPWQIGVLHDRGDTRFAHAFLRALQADPSPTVGDNEPYRMDSIDYTIPRHAYPARPYVEIEVRQDLLGDAAGIERWATYIEDALRTALAS
ncbi:N-formylglutamate amidohydrolase [Sphingomonas sp. SUN019]|uniref:N-formylglutamate amidohydrolase n=1 Tax=Sphingomonas sp. SUN019 TaxID=2937788 RepID=UPI0021642F98|nr:N-formylglutamate amidohydrolase [Sphingomonas sp. SUN019]UVO50313.1 N-formylglutamate amidohydrolase [Sphingomonas sp. SUN019]